MSSKSSGSEDRQYLVLAPGTAPLGRSTDAPIKRQYADLLGGSAQALTLILRLADTGRIQSHGWTLWLHVSVRPELLSIENVDEHRRRFNGTAKRLRIDGTEMGDPFPIVCSLQLIDHVPTTVIGEASITCPAVPAK